MNPNIMLEIVENITEAADELINKSERNLLEEGELIAYAETLCIIQDALLGYDLSVIGLDFDVDNRYLNCAEISPGNMSCRRISLMSMKRRLNNRLAVYFEKILVRDQECFQKRDGVVFLLSEFPDRQAFVVEYAENYEEALLNRFEDGDVFYLDETDEQELFVAIMSEIIGC